MPLGANQMTTTTGNVFRPNIWTKEALLARQSNLVLVPLVSHYDRDIQSSGQTVEIPNISNLTANVKAANTAVTLQSPTETKTTVTINQFYEASILIEDHLEAQAAYDLATAYVKKTGYAIAEKMDSFVAVGLTAATQTVSAYGTAITVSILADAKQKLDEAKAPMTERYVAVPPKGHTDLLKDTNFIRYDATGNGGESNSLVNGKVGHALGMDIYMSQNLVTTAATPTQYNALVFHKEAYAIAVQKSQSFEHQRKTEFLGDLYVSSALWGGSLLRADHVVVVKH